MFMLVSRRYERASLIVTSNKPFSAWGEIFGDDAVAVAMVDRLAHHAEITSFGRRGRQLVELPWSTPRSTPRDQQPPGGTQAAPESTRSAIGVRARVLDALVQLVTGRRPAGAAAAAAAHDEQGSAWPNPVDSEPRGHRVALGDLRQDLELQVLEPSALDPDRDTA